MNIEQTSFPFVPKWVIDEMTIPRPATPDEQAELDAALERYHRASETAQKLSVEFTQARLTVMTERGNYIQVRERLRKDGVDIGNRDRE